MKITTVIVASVLLFSSASAQSPQSQTERNKALVLNATKPAK